MNNDFVSEDKYQEIGVKRFKQDESHNLVVDKNGVTIDSPTELMTKVWSSRPDLQKAFPDIYDQDKKDYWRWWLNRSHLETAVSNVLPLTLLSESLDKDNLLELLKEIIWDNNPELQKKFPDPTKRDSSALYEWWFDEGKNHYFPNQGVGSSPVDLILKFTEDQAVECLSSLKFDLDPSPKVTLLIPVYNAFIELAECLASIKNYVRIDYEVVILDDCSNDSRIHEYCSKINNVKYFRNEMNLGYLNNVNNGVAHCAGEYIVLVNSDLQFIDDSISALIGAMESDASVQVAGPRLIYPDGGLQEAGCCVSHLCETTMIGHGKHINDTRYSFNRYVDYVSGACLCIRKNDFISYGLFDQDLSPAYTEDLDLCTRVLKKGKRVLYVADSTVVHHLSVSSKSMSSEYKYSLSAMNRMKIFEKHGQFYKEYGKIKTIAFYLPQFHTIKENNFWWGEGYTEWTATARAKPNYIDHYQPHVPADMGFYDLSHSDIFEKQARLAKRYNVHAFCFYYYNFGDREILQKPLDNFINSNADIDFCICWANENWTRTWDGLNKNILLEQKALNNDEFLSVIKNMERFLIDNRYIRINGMPLIAIYRVGLFEGIADKIALWRDYWRNKYDEELYLCVVDSIERAKGTSESPESLGFDASIEFPVHQNSTIKSLEDSRAIDGIEYTGTMFDHKEAVNEILSRPHPGYKRFPCVFPSWDNTPRRGNQSTIFDGSHPSIFQKYMEIKACESKMYSGDERLLFINAWNEWGEGAHIEPDMKYGHTWLEVIDKVIKEY